MSCDGAEREGQQQISLFSSCLIILASMAITQREEKRTLEEVEKIHGTQNGQGAVNVTSSWVTGWRKVICSAWR